MANTSDAKIAYFKFSEACLSLLHESYIIIKFFNGPGGSLATELTGTVVLRLRALSATGMRVTVAASCGNVLARAASASEPPAPGQ